MMNYIQIALSFLVAVLGTLFTLRQDGKLTRVGRLFAVSAFAAVLVAFLQERHGQRELYRFDLGSSLQLRLEASYWAPLEEDSKFLANAPMELAIRSAVLGDYLVDFELIGVRDVIRPPASRMSPAYRVSYSAHSFRLSENSERPLAYEYLWDLNGKKVIFKIPTTKFQDLMPGRRWDIRASLWFAGKVFNQYADDDGRISLTLAYVS